jgi:hypothetical protein
MQKRISIMNQRENRLVANCKSVGIREKDKNHNMNRYKTGKTNEPKLIP